MTSAPRLAPSSLNCTPTTPVSSEALAVTVTVPLTDCPAAGAVIDAVGGAVSVEAPPNVAVMVVSAMSRAEQVPVPLQPPPLHPVYVDPVVAAAVRVTVVPTFTTCEQTVPQEIPVGLVTVPVPVPALLIVRRAERGWNVAVTVVAPVRVTVHCAPRTVPQPLQLAREELESGAAVSTTDAPLVKLAEHVAPQLMPDGALVTVPEPLPALRTPSEYVEGGGVVPPLCGSSARKTSDRPVPFMSEVNRTYCPSGENLAKPL